MQELYNSDSQASAESFEVSKVLRNTYALLGLTLAFSALTAGVAMAFNVPHFGLLSLIPTIGLLFAVQKFKNSGMGLILVFALTGWLGVTLAPLLNAFLAAGAGDTIMLALGGTAAIFFAMSGYILITKKNMSYMGGFLMVGMLVAFIAMIANAFMQIPALHLVICGIFLVLSSLMIMYQTSAIIHGGERNYISATVSLYVSLYNIFVVLLQLIGMGGDD